jgi:uncharacterized protein with HEPN domain
MLDHAAEAVELARGRKRAELDTDRLLRYALIHLVELVGEAAARVNPEAREMYSSVPLREAAAMRNRLIHGYDVVDLDILWATITDDLPDLIRRLKAVLREHDQQ